MNTKPLQGFEWGVGDCFGSALARASVKQKTRNLVQAGIVVRFVTDLEL